MNAPVDGNRKRLEQTVTILQVSPSGEYYIEQRFNWQKLRNDGSRLLAIAVCGKSVYCCVRYSDDSFGVEQVVPDSFETITEQLNLKGLKFDLSQHGRMDASILGSGNRLLVLQRKSSTKTIVYVCENGELLAEREIVRKSRTLVQQQQQSITRTFGDFLLMIDINSKALVIVQWKKEDKILDELIVKEFDIPEPCPIKSFAMCEIEAIPHLVLLNEGSKNVLKVYQLVEDAENLQIVYKQQVELKEVKHMVCVFSTPKEGQIITMNCVNLCCYELRVKKERVQNVETRKECVSQSEPRKGNTKC